MKNASIAQGLTVAALATTCLAVALAAEPEVSISLVTDGDLAKRAVQDLHLESFSTFKANVGSIDERQSDLWKAAIYGDALDPGVVAAAKGDLEAYYVDLPVVRTVKVVTSGASDSSRQLVAFECVPINEQPALANLSAKVIEAPPTDADEAPSTSVDTLAVKTVKVHANPGTDVFTKDPTCPPGTVPLARVTLQEKLLYDMQSKPSVDRQLFEELSNIRSEGVVAKPRGAFKHRYAHAARSVQNVGAAATLNVWSPRVNDNDMSLSQIWVVGAGPGGTAFQTVEAGWQVMSFWKTPYSTLFVYATADDYRTTGCYATRCAGSSAQNGESFVLTNSRVLIGRPIASQSESGGEQEAMSIKWMRSASTGSWWLKVNGEWVGYYPASFFAGGPLARAATYIDFGGETAEIPRSAPSAQMGSGVHAAAGIGKAAYQSRLRYIDLTGTILPATGLSASATDPLCYSVSINAPSLPHPDAGTYIYFGGPGADPESLSCR